MGALQSLLENPIDGFPTKGQRNSSCCCHVCGMQFDRGQDRDSISNQQALWSHSHYLAELCGIWLGSPDSHAREFIMSKQTETSSPLAFPSTTLPKRSVSSSKPSVIVSTLIKHTDFTKSERSALKHGFFSTMDMNTAGLSDCSGLEGCHIRGCLYVEHESLVFQAVEGSHQLPSVLTNRKEESFDADVGRTLTRGGERISTGLDAPDHTRSPLMPHSMRRTRRKLWAYFHEGRASPSRHHEGGRCSCHACRKDPKLTEPCQLGDTRYSTADSQTADQPHGRNTLRRGDATGAMDPGNNRLPPPPLRLSWPLCTLRRFGFYGNTLFKLEAGRRAPRGEGHYLFRIRNLREFRQYFEHFVHRRKSLSPPNSPPDRALLGPARPEHRMTLPSRTEFGTPAIDIDSIFGTPTNKPCLAGQNPAHDSLAVENDLDPMLVTQGLVRQKANSLTHASQVSKVSPTCLDWVRQQQEQQQKYQQPTRRPTPHQLPLTDSVQRNDRSVGFLSSCPHLSSTFTNTTTYASKTRSPFCLDSEADDLISLPDPPPPPCSSASLENNGSDGFFTADPQKLYDNVELDWLRTSLTPSERHHDESGPSRDWLLAPAGIPPTPRGRLYTSRRAMTAFVCSNLYPIPSRHHEEEEEAAEEDNATSRSGQRLEVDSVRQLRGLPECPRTPAPPPTSRFSLHCHTGSLQSEHQTPVHERRPATNGSSHLRHTSLPNPISLDTVFSVTRVSDSCFQTNPPILQQTDPSSETFIISETTARGRMEENQQQHPPYYNLSSPEALGQLERTGRSSHSSSICRRRIATDVPSTPDVNMGPGQPFPDTDSTLRFSAIGASVSDDPCVTADLRPRMRSLADLRNQEAVAYSSAHMLCEVPPDGTEPSTSLHYATLDFSLSTPDRAQSSMDLRGPEPSVCAECTSEHFISDAGTPSDRRNAVCPMRVYGTFVHDPTARPSDSSTGSRVRSLSSSGVPAIRPSSMGNVDSELPANYVAICQLQTLAMRAVLNATT